MTTIKLEIGANLRLAIKEIVLAVRAGGGIYHNDIGKNVREAFGIDFSKAIAKSDVLDTCINAKCPRCLQYYGPMECTLEIKQ